MTVEQGPGKYDDVCTKAREETEADACILIVLGGNFGSGMSCQIIANPDTIMQAKAAVVETLGLLLKELKSELTPLPPEAVH